MTMRNRFITGKYSGAVLAGAPAPGRRRGARCQMREIGPAGIVMGQCLAAPPIYTVLPGDRDVLRALRHQDGFAGAQESRAKITACGTALARAPWWVMAGAGWAGGATTPPYLLH